MDKFISHLITFLSGAAIGAAGNYFALKYDDQRRKKEERKRYRRHVKETIEIMPILIKEMKGDFNHPDHKATREIAIVPHRKLPFRNSTNVFTYYEDEHVNLKNNISLLNNLGFLQEIHKFNVPSYIVTESFYQEVKNINII